jgi:Tfp pilus assembly PilM family ATPase
MIQRKNGGVVCVDLGPDHLSVLEVVAGVVTAWASRPLPAGLLFNGDPVEPAMLGDLVRQALGSAGIQGSRAHLTILDEATVSRHLTLPSMPRRELARAMRYQAELHIPFPITKSRWSWSASEPTPTGIQVYMVAAWRDVVDRYAAVATAAGLEPRLLEPRSVAVARTLDQDRALLVDARGTNLHLTLLVDGQPVLVDEQSFDPRDEDRREAMDRLLQRAFRYQSTLPEGAARMAPVLLAGELEVAPLDLPVRGTPVTQVLNGHLPQFPRGFQAGRYLANLGLALRAGK